MSEGPDVPVQIESWQAARRRYHLALVTLYDADVVKAAHDAGGMGLAPRPGNNPANVFDVDHHGTGVRLVVSRELVRDGAEEVLHVSLSWHRPPPPMTIRAARQLGVEIWKRLAGVMVDVRTLHAFLSSGGVLHLVLPEQPRNPNAT